MASLTSQLIISLIDKVSGPAKGAASALKGVADAEKLVGNAGRRGVEQFGTTLDRVSRSAERLKKVSAGGLGWGDTFQRDIDKLKLTSRELEHVQRDYARLQSTMRGMKASAGLAMLDGWRTKTIANIHAVRKAEEDRLARLERRSRGMRGGAHFVAGAIGLGGGAYLAHRGIRAGFGAASDRARESARYSLAGMTDKEKAEAAAKADEVSRKFPSIGRTDVLGHIRQLRARLGDFHHAVDNVESLSKAEVVLKTLGGGEHAGEDLEKLVLALESQGLGNDPKKFSTYLDAFVKAKSLFPDLRGEDFRQYMQRSAASKYGLSDDYLQNVVPTMMQHEGASNFGTQQASAFSALVGGRQTKTAKAHMRAAGLLDKGGKLVGESEFIRNPREWSEKFLAPALERQGITMDEKHRGDVVKAVTTMFSNRKVGEFFASFLVNRAIIDKDRPMLAKAQGTAGADQARREDPYVALGGVVEQLKDVTAAFLGLKPAMFLMNDAARALGNIATTLRTGEPPKGTAAAKTREAWKAPASFWTEKYREERLSREQRNVEESIRQREGTKNDPALRKLRLRAFELRAGADAVNDYATMPPVFSDAERERWEEIDREHRRGMAYSTMPKRQGIAGVPLPTPDPRKRAAMEMPPVQTLEGAKVIENLDQSDAAAVAGTNTGASWLSSLDAELEKAKAKARAAAQELINILSFSANPTVSPQINLPPAGQKRSDSTSLTHSRHAAFSDATNFGYL